MFRYNLIVAGLMAAVSLSSSANGEGDAAVSAASPAVELTLPAGFTLKEKKLTLPTGQTVENVTGLQECGKMLLIVSQREVGAYNTSINRYSAVFRPARLGADSQLILIPFNAAISTDPKASEHTAFIAVKQPDSLLTGVYRYRVGKPGLQKLSFLGRTEGQFTFWRAYKKDDGSTGIGFDMDMIKRRQRIHYYYITRRGGSEVLWGIVDLPTSKQIADRREASISKPKEEQQKRVSTDPPADPAPVPESPEE